MATRARILVLTEDSGKQAQLTLQKLVKEAFKLVVEGVDLNPARVRLEPLPENDRALKAVSANRWKEKAPTLERVLLLGAIAAQLLEPVGFVIFHFDTDRVWAERADSENRQKFEAIIRDGVRRILRGEADPPNHPRPRPKLTAEQIEAVLSRLIIFSPCYSIESWLYQANRELLEHCQARHDSEEHVQLIQAWASNRTMLDECYRPKDDVLPCVADNHNEELARSFPAEEVWLAERSFHESVERIRDCPALLESLQHGMKEPPC